MPNTALSYLIQFLKIFCKSSFAFILRKRACDLKQWFLNLHVHQHHQEDPLKSRLQSPTGCTRLGGAWEEACQTSAQLILMVVVRTPPWETPTWKWFMLLKQRADSLLIYISLWLIFIFKLLFWKFSNILDGEQYAKDGYDLRLDSVILSYFLISTLKDVRS